MPSLSRPDAKSKTSAVVFPVLLVVSVLGCIASSGMIRRHIDYRRDIVLETKNELRELTAKAARDIDLILRQTMTDADGVAAGLNEESISNSEGLERIRRIVEKNDNYYGGSITYRPFGYDPDRRLYAPYYSRLDGKVALTPFDGDYDYTKPENGWYALAMKEGSRWSEPYWCPAGKTIMVTYTSVFYENAGTVDAAPLGMVLIDISMSRIRKIIEDIDLGPSGFGALVSQKGVYLHHPNTEYVVSGKTILEVAEEKNDKNRLIMAEMEARGEGGFLDHISTTTSRPAWLVFAPVPLSGWSLQNTFLKKDIEIDVDTMRRRLIWIVFAVLVFLLAALSCIYCKTSKSMRVAWSMIGAGSLLIAIGIGCIWGIALAYNPAVGIAGVRISDKATLRNTMNDYLNRSAEKHMEPPVYVPTGVFIESLKFTGPSDVLLSGYVWQKFGKAFPEDTNKEFSISRATGVSIERVGWFFRDGIEIVRHRFEAEVRQNLTHETYPLEQARIELRIVPKELNHNIVPVPDLDAYSILNASLLPGLDGGAFIAGWTLKNAYYELRKRDLNTNFGIGRAVTKDNYPALYYNIGIQRNFIDAFISHLTPLIFVSIMLFFLLVLSDRIDAARVFSICVAMFFVIVFSHIDIRGKLSAQEIFYLEYFFFLTYGSILFVALVAGGTLLKVNIWFCGYKSRGPQLLFWPVFLGLVFAVTMAVFLKMGGG